MSRGRIFDIQTNAVYDGPGIRTVVFFKGCPLRCAWCHNPESQSAPISIAWIRSKCRQCGICLSVCDQGARLCLGDSIIRNEALCTCCGNCVESCPSGAVAWIGEEIDAEELAKKALLDRPFFEHSGGGVTLSGGEPTQQPEFMFDLVRRIKKAGVHVALETCGYFSDEMMTHILEEVDLVLFDFKHIDDGKHREAVGVGNAPIIENMIRAVHWPGDKIRFRIPVIPGFNADSESSTAMARFLDEIGYRGQVDLMAYHNYAGSKYDKIGRAADFVDLGSLSELQKSVVEESFRNWNLIPVWGG